MRLNIRPYLLGQFSVPFVKCATAVGAFSRDGKNLTVHFYFWFASASLRTLEGCTSSLLLAHSSASCIACLSWPGQMPYQAHLLDFAFGFDLPGSAPAFPGSAAGLE
eukprot:3072683-Amphidinium_carterae.1